MPLSDSTIHFHFQIIPSDYSALYISILGSASFVVVVREGARANNTMRARGTS
jgi:hypothetical protein